MGVRLYLLSLAAGVLAQVAPSPGTDPFGFITSIGVGGVVAGVIYLWQRDTARQRDEITRQRDEAIKTAGNLVEGMRSIKDAVNASTAAHESATDSLREVIELLAPRQRPSERWDRRETQRGRDG